MCVVTINEKPWTRAKEACRALECKKDRARGVLKKHVSIENKQHKHELERRAATAYPLEWSKNSHPDDYYISEEGMYELVFGSQQPKAKPFRKHCCNVFFRHVHQQLSDKSHAMEIEDLTRRVQVLELTNEAHQQAIEEKDAALAFLSDDLQNREYKNVALQAQMDVYKDQLQKCQDVITHQHKKTMV